MNDVPALEAEREKTLMDIHTYALIIAVSPILTLIGILLVIFLFVLAQKFIRARGKVDKVVNATTIPPIKRDSHNQ